MRPRSVSNLAHSVHQRLLNLAKSSGRPFNELLQNYTMERFLYRLGRSRYRDQFLLKGALMLRVWSAPVARPTMDIDLLGRWAASRDKLESIVHDCLALAVADDGMQFDLKGITAEAITKEAGYEGWRLRFRGGLGNARVVLQVDFAFGDVVVPGPVRVEYPVLLDGPAPTLLAYTPESAIAEKYQAMVALDMANSRMKDFYDLAILARGFAFEGSRLCRAIQATFQRRRTPLPLELPLALTEAFHDDRIKQAQWKAFLRRARLVTEEQEFGRVVVALRAFLMPPTLALVRGQSFVATWSPGGPWRSAEKGERA